MIRRSTVALGVLSFLLVGCRTAIPIPAGAQEVHVVATESEIRLEPATVHAGDVWLVIDAPEGSFVFVGASSPGGHEGDSLTDEDLARLMEGDTQYFSFSGFGVGGCSAQQAADDRGKMGPCGNVMQFAVVAGKYALIRDPDQPVPMAVLEVLP